MKERFMLICAASILAACAERSSSASEASAWTVEPTPILDVHDTALAGPSVLESARFATRLPSGTVVVADQYADALRFFDPQGNTIRVTGRAGSGPGEFGDLMWISRCGSDTLYAWDYSRRVIIVHDSAGAFRREFRPEGNPHEVSCWNPHFFFVMGLPDRYVAPSAEGEVVSAPLWTINARGDSIGGLGSVPFGENRALGRQTRIASASDVLYVGTADSAWVDAYGPDGARKRSLPSGTSARAPTEADYERAIDRLIGVTPDRRVRERFREMYAALPMPDSMPSYVDLRVDPAGILWLVLPALRPKETRLRAFDQNGSVRADITLPLPITVFEVGIDYVLGAYNDPSDLDHVMVFRLNRS